MIPAFCDLITIKNYYFRRMPAIPSKPRPRRISVAGSGTAVPKYVTWLIALLAKSNVEIHNAIAVILNSIMIIVGIAIAVF